MYPDPMRSAGASDERDKDPPDDEPHPRAPARGSVVGPGFSFGRYVLHEEIGAGGMARVFLGRFRGPAKFSRTVAVKCLHPAFAADPELVAMLMDEAHLASRVRHPNVVATLDVVPEAGELFVIMDYVHGESLSQLLRAARAEGREVPLPVASGIVAGMLYGLHAAHEARGERGEPLHIVHRDVSPQNVLVGNDGMTRVFDFGIAKAASRMQHTADGQVKGKLRYMAPEQLRSQPIDRRTDIFAAAAVLWEVVAGRRLFDGADPGAIVTSILAADIAAPGSRRAGVPAALDALVLKGLRRAPAERFADAREMAMALEHAVPPATAREIGDWVERVGGEALAARGARLADLEHAPLLAPSGRGPDEPTAPTSLPATGVHARSGLAAADEETDISASRNALGPDAAIALSSAGSRRPSHARTATLLVASAIAGAAALFLVTGRGGSGGADPARGDATSVSTSASAPVSVPASAPVPASASASVPASVPVPASVSASAQAPAVRPPRPRSGACDPPYVLENGIKRFKKQCL